MNNDVLNDHELSEAASLSEETLKILETSIGHQGMTKVVKSFLNELPKTEESIKRFLIQKDLPEIRKIGHRNKSSSLSVGANGLANLFTKLEQIEKIEAADELNKQIELASVEIASKLNNHLTRPS